jgi:hypothetical protein
MYVRMSKRHTDIPVMEYQKKIIIIKKMINAGKNSIEISTKLKIPKSDFYNICNRENLSFNKISVRGGRKLGSKDLVKRIRKCKDKKLIKGGDDYIINKNKDDNIDTFLNSILDEAKRPITLNDVEEYDNTN